MSHTGVADAAPSGSSISLLLQSEDAALVRRQLQKWSNLPSSVNRMTKRCFFYFLLLTSLFRLNFRGYRI
jgi:hypothetical protein